MCTTRKKTCWPAFAASQWDLLRRGWGYLHVMDGLILEWRGLGSRGMPSADVNVIVDTLETGSNVQHLVLPLGIPLSVPVLHLLYQY
jgi:hypothetical protein